MMLERIIEGLFPHLDLSTRTYYILPESQGARASDEGRVTDKKNVGIANSFSVCKAAPGLDGVSIAQRFPRCSDLLRRKHQSLILLLQVTWRHRSLRNDRCCVSEEKFSLNLLRTTITSAKSLQRLYEQFPSLNEIRIPRCVIGLDLEFVEHHCFLDDSIVAYGTTVYVRSQRDDGSVAVHLLT